MNHTSITYFDRVSAVGGKILEALGGSPVGSETDEYLKLVGEIYTKMAEIHDKLVNVTIEVSLAQTPAEAQKALELVQQMGLEEAMRAAEMCDELERLGHQLRQLPYDQFGLTADEKATWDELLQNLEQREGGTSRLYDEKMYDLRVLRYSGNDLDSIKAKVNEISNALVIQKAQFERLAKVANAVRERR